MKQVMVHGPGLAGMQQAGGIRRFNIRGLFDVLVHTIGRTRTVLGDKPRIFCELHSASKAKDEFEEGGFEVINSNTVGGSILALEQQLRLVDPAVTELVVVGLRFNLLSVVKRTKMPGRQIFWLGVGSPDCNSHHGLSPLATSGIMECGITFVDLCLFKNRVMKDPVTPQVPATPSPTFSHVLVVLHNASEDDKKQLANTLQKIRCKTIGKFEIKKKDVGAQHHVDIKFTGVPDEHAALAVSLQSCRREIGSITISALA